MLRCCEYWSVASCCGVVSVTQDTGFRIMCCRVYTSVVYSALVYTTTYIVEYLAKAIGGLLGK